MSAIKPIDGKTVHRIQSGQVIVDLCSVVKELVENGIDAGATSIEVRFKNQGLDAIEVQDNGSGISPNNYETVALKHYTSKLASYADLETLQTFGFRGEALSSLCALSRFSIVTCLAADVPKGAKLEFESSGKLRNTSVVAAKEGTTVYVEGLFHNLPVRRRELERNIKREWGKVLVLLGQYACIQVGMKFTASQQPSKGKRVILFSTKGNHTTRENIINVFGAKTIGALVPLDLQLELQPTSRPRGDDEDEAVHLIRVLGHVSRPVTGEGRQTPDRQMFFVNGRPCGLPQFAKVFNEVYRSYNSTQAPFVFADIQLDTHLYDVNVSPDKRTILFHEQSRMLENLREALGELFEAQDYSVPIAQLSTLRSSRKTATPRMETPATNIQADDTVGGVGDAAHDPASVSGVVGTTTQPARARPSFVSTEFNGLDNSKDKIPSLVSVTSPGRESESDPVGRMIDANVEQVQERNEEQPTEQELSVPSGISGVPVAMSVMDSGAPTPVNGDDVESDRGASLSSEEAVSQSRDVEMLAPLDSSSRRPNETGTRTRALPSHAISMTDARARDTGITIVNIGHEISAGNLTPSYSKPRVITKPNLLQSRGGRNERRAAGSSSSTPSFADRLSQMFSATIPSTSASKSSRAGDTDSPRNSPIILRSHAMMNREDTEDNEDDDIPNGKDSHDIDTEEASAASSDSRASSPISKDPSPSQNLEHLQQPIAAPDPEVQVDATRSVSAGLIMSAAEVKTVHASKGNKSRDSTLQHAQVLRLDETSIQSNYVAWRASLTGYSARNGMTEKPDSIVSDAEEKLSLTVSKADFRRMKIVGQFNLGFIVALRYASNGSLDGAPSQDDDEVFIVDQHASDEKYNFERLQAGTVIDSQRLVHPKRLELTAVEEEIVRDYIDSIKKNGFDIDIDDSGDFAVGSRCQLLALPLSKETTFGLADLEELISLLGEHQATGDTATPRPSKVRKMFAMRACRSSVMIGKALTQKHMENLVRHMGELDKPWNCPHGRPTMRHLSSLGSWDEHGWYGDMGEATSAQWASYANGP